MDVKIQSVRLEQESTFEHLVGQIQSQCPNHLLCVVDGSILKFYDKKKLITLRI